MVKAIQARMRAAAVGLSILLPPGVGSAATVTIGDVIPDPTENPVITAPTAVFAVSGGSLGFLTAIGALSDPVATVNVTAAPTGTLSVFSLGASVPALLGTREDESITPNLVTVLYAIGSGSSAASFGDYVLMSLSGSGFGDDGTFTAHSLKIVGARIEAPQIPLPGALASLGSVVILVAGFLRSRENTQG